jgi:hypothetical protein
MAALKINFIFCNLAFNDAIARMDDAERLRTLDRLREAIARCPNALGLGSFWAHMQTCSDDEWDRTMARIAHWQVLSGSCVRPRAPAVRSSALRPCCVHGLAPVSAVALAYAVVRGRRSAGLPRIRLTGGKYFRTPAKKFRVPLKENDFTLKK